MDKSGVLGESHKIKTATLAMWTRRTFHECAAELSTISEDFRSAHTNRFGWDHAKRDRVLRDTSERGVELLRILALSIRADQDHGLTNRSATPVGALKANVTESEVPLLINNYRPPYTRVDGTSRLDLRQALNKIAHADPGRSGFYADADAHDLILSGKDGRDIWVAVISLIDLCRVIKLLPDARITNELKNR